MKKMIVTALIVCAGLVHAAPLTAPTNYFSGYLLVSSASTNSGTTGLSVTNAYACFPVADIDNLSEANADESSGSTSVIIYALTKEFYDQLQSVTSTNRITKVTITEAISAGSATAITVEHRTKSLLTIDTTSVPAE